MNDVVNEIKKEVVTPTDETTTKSVEVNNKINVINVNDMLSAFKDYKSARANTDEKIIENENWFRQNYWQYLKKNPDNKEPMSGTLFESIWNKHADFMDNEPKATFLAREENDEKEADRLSKIVPVILKKVKFDKTYSEYCWYKIKQGFGAISVTWDDSQENGLGEIVIKDIDLLRLYYEPNTSDIQDSRYVFVPNLIDNDILKEQYPDKFSSTENTEDMQNDLSIQSYEKEDQNILTKKTVVLDVYEKMINSDGKQIVHLTKIANSKVLESSRLITELAETGIYQHGMYPIIVGQFIPLANSLEGIGLIDLGTNSQAYIDKLDEIIINNAFVTGKDRKLVRKDSGINIDDLMDLSKDVIECANTSEEACRTLVTKPVPAFVISHRENKKNELKEVTCNRDFNAGGSTGGVTAASAIAALQETGNKTSRDLVRTNYDEYAQMIYLVVELIREFYTEDRTFRITGENGKREYISYNNSLLKNQVTNLDDMYIESLNGEKILNENWEAEYRKPVYDIEIVANRENPFSTASHNELLLALYDKGVFNPQNAVAASVLLENMKFDGKEKILATIKNNGNMQEQIIQMQMQMQQLQAIIQQLQSDSLPEGNANINSPIM